MEKKIKGRPRTLVIGAGAAGSMAIDLMQHNGVEIPGTPVVVVDDASRQGELVHGVPILGATEDIPNLVDVYGVEQILLAIPSATRDQRLRIVDICTQTDVALYTLPSAFLGTDVTKVHHAPAIEIDAAELLSRPEILLDTEKVAAYIKGKTVLVTGGGGSIGSELCRQLVPAEPARIVIFDIYENTAYELQQELKRKYPDSDISFEVEIGSIRDEERLDDLFNAIQPDVVFHAAAHKHVPLMEHNPREAVINNVFGTLNVVREADKHGVERFVLISTDKAVNPTSLMGATKRMCEMIIQYYAAHSKTVFTAVRFGNVLGSHGSVVPLFKQQIAQGGPITLTHKDITRYFMTIPEAARLVIQAGGLAKGGEIFILNMGEPVRIYDLAERMIKLSGYTPDVDVEIKVTGLRPGEKLYEELLMDTEETLPTESSDIMVSGAKPMDEAVVKAALVELKNAVESEDRDGIKQAVAKAVPTYTITENA